MSRTPVSRRHFLKASAATGLTTGIGSLLPPGISYAADRPSFSHGLQSGDVSHDSALIWARSNGPASMSIEVSSNESFAKSERLAPSLLLEDTDFTAKRLLGKLLPDQRYFFRLQLHALNKHGTRSEPIIGSFRTAPRTVRDIRFVWSGDTAGQGWGIDVDRGGMQTYATMLGHQPDFFIHSGDTIYADGPIAATQAMPDGGTWNNLVAEGVEKVAESLDEFRGRWKYNLLDEHVQAFNQSVPTFFQWDDHEVVNNWSSAKDLADDDRYTEKSVPLLAARASRAFHEMTPIRTNPDEPGRIYRKVSYGPLLDVFFLDLRSYRGPNGDGMEERRSADSTILGDDQLQWLKSGLITSKATWKVIASDMPIGLKVWNDWQNQTGVEAIANGDDGRARGRELDLASALRFAKRFEVRNIVFLTADVHYTAAHYYNPNNAAEQDFDPFWEFVSGPLHAGSFGPNDLDMTFGPEVRFVKAPAQGQVNLPPSAGLQFFGLVDISADTRQMSVKLMDRDDQELYAITLDPVA